MPLKRVTLVTPASPPIVMTLWCRQGRWTAKAAVPGVAGVYRASADTPSAAFAALAQWRGIPPVLERLGIDAPADPEQHLASLGYTVFAPNMLAFKE